MRRLLRDPFLWISLLLVIAFPAVDFYILERNYFDSGIYFSFILVNLALTGLWFVWIAVCVYVGAYRWKEKRWSGLAPLGLALCVFPLYLFLGSTTLWQNYNFHEFHKARLDYARRAGDWGNCKAGTGTWDSRSYSTLSIEKSAPEVFGTASGPYVFYSAFVGIPDGMWGFLYAPSLDDPIKALPQLNLEFAVLWDRDACVFLAGNR